MAHVNFPWLGVSVSGNSPWHSPFHGFIIERMVWRQKINEKLFFCIRIGLPSNNDSLKKISPIPYFCASKSSLSNIEVYGWPKQELSTYGSSGETAKSVRLFFFLKDQWGSNKLWIMQYRVGAYTGSDSSRKPDWTSLDRPIQRQFDFRLHKSKTGQFLEVGTIDSTLELISNQFN